MLIELFFTGNGDSDVMTQAREPFAVMDGNPPNCDFSTKTKRGFYLSKGLSLVILVIFVLALVATSFIVYNFAACPRTDQLANVTKYELHTNHCGDQSKLLVIPISTEPNKNVIPLENNHVTKGNHKSHDVIDNSAIDVRLPKSVKPEKYYLKLTPYICNGNFTFDGEVSIVLRVQNETNRVTFHGVELSFHKINLYSKKNGRPVKIIKRTEDLSRQFHVLQLAENLKASEHYVLNITYVGILNDNLHGFYRSSYEENNVTR